MAQTLLHSRFNNVATNTIDYWMKADTSHVTSCDIIGALATAPWTDKSTLQLYLHVPYCAQKCTFCAFSGGNSLDFKSAERYADLLIWQMQEYLAISQAANKSISSVNIGGGSPDLLRGSIKKILKAVHALPGYSEKTEISVEFTLSTVSDDFIDALVDFRVTKTSFGVQVIDPQVRRYLQMPSALRNMDETCEKLAKGVPIINVDLVTGFPGQTIKTVIQDLEYFIHHPTINSISTYLLTPGAAPKLVSDIATGAIPAPPSQQEQGLFRLHSYATLLRHGWVRKGTNTYMDPSKIPANVMSVVAGNECIGARRYDDFLIGCGPQAISFIPGARIENTVDIDTWMQSAEKGCHSFALQKCSLEHQRDTALWVFPLIADGLNKNEYEELKTSGVIDETQINNFETFIKEGLITETADRYFLTIVGEVFMGHLVRQLKKVADQDVVEDYIKEGYILGKMLSENKIPRSNAVNNRQSAKLIK